MISKKILQERKKRLAKKFQDLSPQSSYFTFTLGKMSLAFPLKEGRAIASLQGPKQKIIYRPPSFPPGFLGIIHWNYSLVHLLDLADLLDEDPKWPPLYGLIFCHQSFYYGLPIYSQIEKITLISQNISPSSHPFLSGQSQWQGRTIWVLDPMEFVATLGEDRDESVLIVVDE